MKLWDYTYLLEEQLAVNERKLFAMGEKQLIANSQELTTNFQKYNSL